MYNFNNKARKFYEVYDGEVGEFIFGKEFTYNKDEYFFNTEDEIPDADVDWADDGNVFWKVGDKLDFICDYYSYTGVYEDSYLLGDPMTVTEDMTISYVDLGDGNLRQSFRFTDLYQQSYWTPALYR